MHGAFLRSGNFYAANGLRDRHHKWVKHQPVLTRRAAYRDFQTAADKKRLGAASPFSCSYQPATKGASSDQFRFLLRR